MGIRQTLAYAANGLGSWLAPSPASGAPLAAGGDRPQLTDRQGFLLPHVRTFSGLVNTFSRIYSAKWDEAIKRFPADAQSMRNDCYLMALFDERTVPLSRWKWQIDDDVDEAGASKKDAKREEVRAGLEAVIRRTWRLHALREYMREAVWFGRYGAQVARGVELVQGVPRQVIVRHLPVHGDKILTDFDGFDAVAINATAIGSREHDFGDEITYTDRMPVLRLRNAEWRQRFVIQKWRIRDGEYFDPYSAGQVGGIGLRHYIYWAWWLRDEMLSWATDFLEKVGSLGLIIFYYEEGNDGSFQKASQAAKDASNQNAIAVPIPKGKDPKTAGFDIVPANVSGAQFLKEFIGDYFERHIERMVVGQTLSGSAEGSGLGGTGVARLHMDTKFQLLAADAECFDDGYTEDLVRPTLELNWPGCPYRFRWKHILPDPEAEGKLAAAQTFVGMGGEIEEDEARELAGLRVPQPGARTLGGKPAMGGAGGDGSASGGGREPQTAAAGDDSEDDEPVPGMAELVAAMFEAAAEGDSLSVDRLVELGQNPEELARIVGGEPEFVGYSAQWEPPAQGRKNWRLPLPGGGYRYSPTQPKERQPGQETPAGLAKRLKAEREPGRQEARVTWQRAAESPGEVDPQDLAALGEQLQRLTRDELRETVRGIGKKVGGLKRDLIDRMLAHARGDRDEPVPAATAGRRKNKAKARSDSFAALVKSFGGINPNDHAFKATYGSMREAIEYGIPLFVFSKDAGGVDVLAEELANNGYMSVPGNRNAADYLLEKIAEKHRAFISEDADEVEEAYNEYLLAEEEARYGTADPAELEKILLRSEADARREVTEGILGIDPSEHRDGVGDEAGRDEPGDSYEGDIGTDDAKLDAFFDFLDIDPPPAAAPAPAPAEDNARPRGLRSTSTAQRDIFGNVRETPKPARTGTQITIEDAIRDTWDRKAEEWASDRGLKIEARQLGKFKAGGQWYRVGKAEDGYPVTLEYQSPRSGFTSIGNRSGN